MNKDIHPIKYVVKIIHDNRYATADSYDTSFNVEINSNFLSYEEAEKFALEHKGCYCEIYKLVSYIHTDTTYNDLSSWIDREPEYYNGGEND